MKPSIEQWCRKPRNGMITCKLTVIIKTCVGSTEEIIIVKGRMEYIGTLLE